MVRNVNSVLFLHGFNSHPDTRKAQTTRVACAQLQPAPVFAAPLLSGSPDRALCQAHAALNRLPAPTLVIGSSLGGFLALWLSQQHTMNPTVLLNPALDPLRFVMAHMGEVFANPVTGERIVITPRMAEALTPLSLKAPRYPERIIALLADDDEVIDHRHTRQLLSACRLIECPNAGHALVSYADHLAAVLAHGGLIWPVMPDQ